MVKLEYGKEVVYTTTEHPFYVNNNWIPASKLKVNDLLFLHNKTTLPLKSITIIDTLVKVYNFTVEDEHNYFVGEHKVLVHNTCPPDLVGFRRTHILNRHGPGSNIPGKTEFLPSWSHNEIIDEINKIANDPKAPMGMGKWNSPYKTGTVNGIDIRVDFYPTNHPIYSEKFQRDIQQTLLLILKILLMNNVNFEYIKQFINSTIELVKDSLDQETKDSVYHYLTHDEYEMAFEGLFIEIMNLNEVPKIDIEKCEEIGLLLKLDKESVFDYNFWEKFKQYKSLKR